MKYLKNSSNSLLGLAFLVLLGLTACGGGGGSSTASAPTPITTAPVASGASNQLADSVAVSGYSALSIASRTSSSMQTAGIKGLFQNLFSRLIPSAMAANTCGTDAYKLVGVNADGSSTPIQVTTGTDQCGVGFRSMFDAGNYILLTGDSIYKDDLTCNLVFLNKSNGELFCVGETVPAKYDILGQTAWKNYARLQLSTDKNYLFLEAAAVIFDSNNQITGKKTKLLRFDLSDTAKGPQGSILVDGFQNSWLTASGSGFAGDASQFEGFEIKNYAGLDNGDAMVMYSRSIYSTGGASMTNLNRQNNFYYRFETDGTYSRIEVDFAAASTLVQAEMASSGNNNSYASTIYEIPCFFKSPVNKDKFYFALPFAYYDGSRNVNRSLIVSAVRPSASDTRLSVSRYTATSLCGNAWGQTPIQVINGIHYTLESAWIYNPITFSSGQVTALIKKDLGLATETPQNDVVLTLDNSNSSTPGMWWGNKKVYVSKDYLYIQEPYSGSWMPNATPGDSIKRYDPANFNSAAAVGSQLGTPVSVLASADNISVQSVAPTTTDNLLKIVGRRTDDADLVKVYGTIDEAGLLAWAAQRSTTYSPVTIVKL